MSRFCPIYAAYSVTVSCQIALFQQLVLHWGRFSWFSRFNRFSN